MSTYYLLPPRSVIGDHMAAFLHALLPGLDWDCATRRNLADAVEAAATVHDDVYVVYREDLPADETAARALADGFGAEPGDEVIEVRLGLPPGHLSSRRWKVA